MQTCTKCKVKDAIFMRHYSGQKLCGECFCESIETKVRATISNYGMFKPNDRIMVAISGGKDSASLLYMLATIEKKFPGASLCAVTVDEGIKGYRDEALKLAASTCRKLGVEHIVTSFKDLFGVKLDELVRISRERSRGRLLTPCAYCGVLRRRALNLTARAAGVHKLATAHNLDDEAQTILLNLIHGDVMRLARVKPVLTGKLKLVQRVKPLTELIEKEIALYAYLKKMKFQSIPCPYSSIALRSSIRDMLNRLEAMHTGVKFTLFSSIERIRPALKVATKRVTLQSCRLCDEPTVSELCKPCELLQELGISNYLSKV